MAKRLCKGTFPTHEEAGKIRKQLETNPEVCDNCPFEKCSFAEYLWGSKDQK